MRRHLQKTSALRSGMRLLAMAVLALGLTAFGSCEDDALLDPEGGDGCNTHHCNPRIQADVVEHENPARF